MKFKLFVLLFVCALPAWSQPTQEKSLDAWTPKDILNTKYLHSVTFSPDGRKVVWMQKRAVEDEDKYVNDLYLALLEVRKDGKFKTVRLTNADENDHDPLFSRNGETLYFLSSRKAGKILWSLSMYGGEPAEVDSFPQGISNLAWLNDSTLTFVSTEGKTLYEKQMEEQHDKTMVVEDSVHWNTDRVYAFDIKNKTTRRLTDNPYPVSDYAISRNGQWLLTALKMSPHYGVDGYPKPAFYLYDLQHGGKTQVLKGLQTPKSFKFTPDSKGFYFMADSSSDAQWNGAGITLLYYYDLAQKNRTKVNLDWEKGLGHGYELAQEHVVAQLANGTTYTTAYYAKKGNQWAKTSIDLGAMQEHITGITISEDGTKMIFDYSTASQLPEYYIADISAQKGKLSLSHQQQLVELNEEISKKETARAEVMRWNGYAGDEVTGILYYPKDYEAGKKYPLVLSIHGGPSGWDTDAWDDSWAYFPQLYSQRGAFVLKPNYHGSGNHGLAFVESIKKNYYEPELEDVINGINVLVEKGLVDPEKLGTQGWSNGAILTTMLTVKYPDMFKAAAPGAGDVNWTSDYGTCQFGVTFDQSYFGGAPWDDVDGKQYNETYILKSPIFEMDKVKTPTIIFHGSEDRAVPRDQGWEYYRALQQNKQAPVRFLWFPGQEHGIDKPSYQLRKMKEELAWFDKYLFDTYQPENEAFKEESPLAILLNQEKAANDSGAYGVMKNKVLVPEVLPVKEDSIAIGRFEVTNAQYKAFEPTYRFKATDANKPICGIGLEKAKAYTVWLSKETGATYRLPNVKEAKKLQQEARKAGAKENTLNYWAGYEITWEELADFKKKFGTTKTSLIKEVGNYKPVSVGEAKIYDLGGNVAELAADGSVYGYSAYDYVDPNQPASNASAEHTGFRIVKDGK